MPEIFRLCDAVTVLRDGRHVVTQPAGGIDEGTVVQQMIGRRLEQYFPAHVNATIGDEVLRVEHLTVPRQFSDVSFTLRAGEVLGLAGLVGAGRSEVARAIFGLEPEVRGTIFLRGTPVRVSSPREAMTLGIGLVPEDRKRQGLVLAMTAGENASLPTLPSLARWGWVNRRAERTTVGRFFERLRVRDELTDAPAAAMSGGNQQKVVLAKWLAARSRVLMLDEPTRGVDVGAKAELHAWIDRLAGEGTAVLLISSELPELINLSTRIVVLREGRVVGEVSRDAATQEVLLRLMAGIDVSKGVSRGQSS
jgi:ABC-type sugar transport system ATPase subunit